MTLLAIDTAGPYASVALFDGRAVVAEETWQALRHHDDQLFPAIERVLALGAMTRADVTRVAVAVGPGSFTGVRIGVAAAQGIARASGAAAIGVSSLDAIAHPFAGSRVRVCALVPAGRGEHYAAMYREHRGSWSRRSGILVGTIAALSRALARDTLFAGDIDEATIAELRSSLGPRALLPPASELARRAGHVAELAWASAEAGGAVAPEALEPVYLRAPAIHGAAGELLAADAADGMASALRQEA